MNSDFEDNGRRPTSDDIVKLHGRRLVWLNALIIPKPNSKPGERTRRRSAFRMKSLLHVIERNDPYHVGVKLNVATIAVGMGCDPRTAGRAISDCRAAGLLNDGESEGRVSTYKIQWDVVAQMILDNPATIDVIAPHEAPPRQRELPIDASTQDTCAPNPGHLRPEPRTVVRATQDSCASDPGQLCAQPRTVVRATQDTCAGDTLYPRTRISGSGSGSGTGEYQSISQEPEPAPEPVMADDLDLDCDDKLRWHRGPNWIRPDGKQNTAFLGRIKNLLWSVGRCIPLYDPEVVERVFRFCVREGAVTAVDRLAFFAEAACDHRSATKRPGGILKESIWSNRRVALQCDLAVARQMVWELDSGELTRRKAQREHERVVAIELRILATEDDPRTHTDQWLWRMRSQERKDAERLAAAEKKAEEARQAAEAERQKLEERRLRERALDLIRNATDEQIVEWLGAETLLIRQFRKNGRKLLQDFLVPIVTDQLKGTHEATDSVFETPDAPEASIVGPDDAHSREAATAEGYAARGGD